MNRRSFFKSAAALAATAFACPSALAEIPSPVREINPAYVTAEYGIQFICVPKWAFLPDGDFKPILHLVDNPGIGKGGELKQPI